MKYFIHILLWISNLGLHIDNHQKKKKKEDSGNLSQENNHKVGRYLYMYNNYQLTLFVTVKS